MRRLNVASLSLLQPEKHIAQVKRDLSISAPFTAHTSQLPSLPMKIQYVAYLARTIKHSSIKGYLAAVRHLHIRSSYELDLKKIFRLQLICRGIKRSQGDTSRIRLPITITHLKLFFQLLAISNTTSYDSIMLWAVMTLAFFGFLRLGEMTCNSPYSPATHLSPSDVTLLPNSVSPEHMSVRIKGAVSRQSSSFCLVFPITRP